MYLCFIAYIMIFSLHIYDDLSNMCLHHCTPHPMRVNLCVLKFTIGFCSSQRLARVKLCSECESEYEVAQLMCGFILKMILLQPCRSTSKKSEGNMCLALHGQRLAKFWCSLTAASERIEVCCCFTTVNPSGLSRPTFAPHVGAEHSVFLISSHFKNCKTVKGVGTLPSILKMPARS